ncbi:MAG: phage integrase N-terminal SAM-like domain-containing protein, partial [Oscillospiraceae bacterium]
MTHEEAVAKLRMDMALRGMAKGGEKQYVLQSQKFMKHFDKPVEELEEPDLRAYLEYLNNQGTLSPATLNTYNSALRFFFEVTLEKN